MDAGGRQLENGTYLHTQEVNEMQGPIDAIQPAPNLVISAMPNGFSLIELSEIRKDVFP